MRKFYYNSNDRCLMNSKAYKRFKLFEATFVVLTLFAISFTACSIDSAFYGSQNVDSSSKSEFTVYIQMKSYSNSFFSKYDLDLEIDGEPFSHLENGEKYGEAVTLQEGKHILSAHKSDSDKPKASYTFSVSDDMILIGEIKHENSRVEFVDMSSTNADDRFEASMPELTGKLLKDACALAEEQGFINIIGYKGDHEHLFDESHIVVEQNYPAGSTIKIYDEVRLECVDADRYFDDLLRGKSLSEVILLSEELGFATEVVRHSNDKWGNVNVTDNDIWEVTKAKQDSGFSAIVDVIYLGTTEQRENAEAESQRQKQIKTIQSIKLTNPNKSKTKQNDIVLVPDDVYNLVFNVMPKGVTETDLDISVNPEKVEILSTNFYDTDECTVMTIEIHILQFYPKYDDHATISFKPHKGDSSYLIMDIHYAAFEEPEPITMRVGEETEVIFKVRPAYYDIKQFDLHSNPYDVGIYDVEILDTEKDYDNNCQYLRTRIKCDGKWNFAEHEVMLNDKNQYYGTEIKITVVD